ncbi:MAG: hypothetical protein M0D55_02015 [Elusimicrobiota bacterium]|nr:MAG: hypothetical protein M0D55_02015 [Elusimicrobiota bacterium]
MKAAIREMDREFRAGRIPGAKESHNILLRHPRLSYRLSFLMPIYIGLQELRTRGLVKGAKNFIEYFAHQFRKMTRIVIFVKAPPPEPVVSLRKEVKEGSERLDQGEMAALRAGR